MLAYLIIISFLIFNKLCLLTSVAGIWLLWLLSPVIAISTFVQFLFPYLGSYVLICFKNHKMGFFIFKDGNDEDPTTFSSSLYCWASLLFGPLSVIVLFVPGNDMRALYIVLSGLFTISFIPYHIFRFIWPEKSKKNCQFPSVTSL